MHLLTLVLGLEKPRWEHTGTVDVQDGARLNKVSYEFTDAAADSFGACYLRPDVRPP